MTTQSETMPALPATTAARRRFFPPGMRSRLKLHPLELLGLIAVLLAAALLNFFWLDREGYANTYYAAAVKSMLQSWHNFFFVSFDPGGFVSVDKPPLGFWIQTASAEVFGFHGWSLLLPEALAGVLSVVLLYVLVRRAFGPVAGLLAALALALTPVAVAVNRNNTIDSLLVFTLLLAAVAVLQAARSGRLRWLLLGMALVGLGFNIKMMQAYLALPAFYLVYLVAAPHGWTRRLVHLALATVVLVAVSFAWIAAVDLTPAWDRPYVGSSQHNSALELALGYNGLERLFGRTWGRPATGNTRADGAAQARDAGLGGFALPTAQTGSAGPFTGAGADAPRLDGFGGPGGGGENGAAGPLRLINTQLGGQVSWLLVPALAGIVVGLWQARPRRRDPRWQNVLLWSAWLLPAAAFFSVAGYFHRYYLVMLAPPIAALAGIGLVALWRAWPRDGRHAWLLPVALVATAAFQAHLLRPYPDWSHWLTPVVVGLCVGAAVVLAAIRLMPRVRMRASIRGGAAALAMAAVLIAPGVWSIATVRQASAGGLGALPGGGPSAAPGFGRLPRIVNGDRRFFDDGIRTDSGTDGDQSALLADDGRPAPAVGSFPIGGPPGGPEVRGIDQALLSYLEENRGGYRFLLATNNEQTAASIILQTGEPVMAMGGFLGSDPILTPEDLARDVANGTVRFFLIGGGPGGQNNALTSWIRANATPVPNSAWGGATTSTTGGFGVQLYQFTSAGSGT
jgi:4-amino-4-deoxy-L-arabinose transferase-like glycosyltransferase